MSAPTIAVRGDLDALDATTRRALLARDSFCAVPRGPAHGAAYSASHDSVIRDRTAGILERVRERGDDALRALAIEYDGVDLDAVGAQHVRDDDPRGSSLEVPREECDAALARLDPSLRRAMQRAADNIRAVHEAFRPVASEFVTADGVRIGRRPDALQRVGVYAPGGRAAYPSSLLMGALPARVAGVSEIIVCSPPASDGWPAPVVLAAAALAGVDRLFAVGGAGAVAAMAYGTPTIPSVDRIVGPGNAFVAEAKRQVSHAVGIDSPAGPSELLVLADDSAEPQLIAREMLAQAEHDPHAAVVLMTTSRTLARDVESELTAGMSAAARASTIRAALASRGAILTATSLDTAIAFASQWAPEHLLLLVAPAERERALAALRGCGTILLGEGASVVFGDYMTGANHVLPTGGAGRAWSGLSTQDFVRWTTWQRVDVAAAGRMAGDSAVFATAEGLDAHALAAVAWEAR